MAPLFLYVYLASVPHIIDNSIFWQKSILGPKIIIRAFGQILARPIALGGILSTIGILCHFVFGIVNNQAELLHNLNNIKTIKPHNTNKK